MEKVNVDREQLLEIVRKNYETHKNEVATAVQGYHIEVVEKLEDALAKAKAGEKFITNLSLVPPSDHTKDYERIIRMLELSSDTTVQLDTHQFTQYVLDEWTWRDAARVLNASYSSKLGNF